ncbi:bacteriocin immunity protein [Streptosporangium subroseum]|uniref:bacteriocin immunity protein n=1 Tax=Streptosporangium subroseum TaxID=106412 RepID=UPI0034183600
MDLRSELLPPPVDHQRLDEICSEIEQISDVIARGGPADDAVAAFNERTGHEYTPLDFAEYYGWRDLEDFAREAARPAWPKVPDVTRDELVEIVCRIVANDPEADYYLRLFEVNVPHPQAADLIFHPPAELQDAPSEAIVEAALSYRAIVL